MTLGTVQLGMPYGAANITGQPSEEEAKTLLLHAIEHGVSVFDCARAYGKAESILGSVLGETMDREFHVITKLDPLVSFECEDMSPANAEIIEAVRESVERSCQELGRSYIDTLLLHRWHHRKAFNELIWKTLQGLKSEGRIKNIGVSVYGPDQAIEALLDPTIEHIQLPLNLLDWRWRDAKFQTIVRTRPSVVIHARSVYLQGVLLSPAGYWPRVQGVSPQNVIDTLDFIVDELARLNRADLCISYVRSFPWVTGVVVGAETEEQLEDSIKCFQCPALIDEERSFVDRMLPIVPASLLNPAHWPPGRRAN